MRVAISLRLASEDWEQASAYVVEAERLGVDCLWSAEAWGHDAVTPLAFMAARTSRIRLGTGIMQAGTRTPALIAMTAMSLAAMTDNRFILGLGVSGPQVIEGWHGVPFAHPLGRMRETIEIVRKVFSGAKVTYEGKHFQLPRPGGEGKPLRLSQPANTEIPIYLATLSPKMLELTGELADGWLGTSFVPESAKASLDLIEKGAAKAGRSLADVDISQGTEVAFGDNVDEMVAARKPGLAFSLGGMGSATTNFYNDAYARQGFAEVADEVRQLWVAGRRDDAAAAVPDEMVLATTLIGTEAMVRERLKVWRDAGVTTIRLYPAGATLDERLTTLARALELLP